MAWSKRFEKFPFLLAEGHEEICKRFPKKHYISSYKTDRKCKKYATSFPGLAPGLGEASAEDFCDLPGLQFDRLDSATRKSSVWSLEIPDE